MNDEASTSLSAEMPGTILVPGKRMGLWQLLAAIVVGIMMAATAWTMARSGPFAIPLVIFAVMIVAGTVKLWLRPPQMEITAEFFRWRLQGVAHQTPRTNVANVVLHARQALLLFHDAQFVEPAKTQESLNKTQRKTGVHAIYPAGVFDLTQVNQVREALGWVPQQVDPRGEVLSEFDHSLSRATPHVWVTPLVVAMNVIVLGLMFALYWRNPAAYGPAETGSLPAELMLLWGANYGPLAATSQPWRLLTSVFMHWSLMHLAFNMWVLWDVGRLVERLVGNGPFLVAYLFAGVCGSLASVAWNPPLVSAGASGAVFGVFGVMLGFVIRRRQEIAAEVLQQHRASCVSFLVFNLLMGAGLSGVDMAAHVGGLLGGLASGLVLTPVFAPVGLARWRVIPQALVCGLVVVGAIALLPKPTADMRREVMSVFRQEEQLGKLFQAELQGLAETRPKELPRVVREKVLVPWEAARQRLSTLEHVSEKDRFTQQSIAEFMRLRGESWALLAEAVAEDSTIKQGQSLEKIDEARKVFQRWLNADGPRFGMKSEMPPTSVEKDVARMAAVESRVMPNLNKLTQERREKRLADPEFAKRLEQEVLSPWRAALDRLQRTIQASRSQGKPPAPQVERMVKFMELRAEAWQLEVAAAQNNDPAQAKLAAEKHHAAEQMLKEEHPKGD